MQLFLLSRVQLIAEWQKPLWTTQDFVQEECYGDDDAFCAVTRFF
jgi:hypothetical protein